MSTTKKTKRKPGNSRGPLPGQAAKLKALALKNKAHPERAEAFLTMLTSCTQGRHRTLPTPERIGTEAGRKLHRAAVAAVKSLQPGEVLLVQSSFHILNMDGSVRVATLSKRPMTIQYARWRKAVLTRDGHTCQECGAASGLVAHHIKHWRHHPALRFTVSNGVTLCHTCHTKKHPHLKWKK